MELNFFHNCYRYRYIFNSSQLLIRRNRRTMLPNITSNWIFHGTKFIPRNSIRIEAALEVATTCSQKLPLVATLHPLPQNYAGNMRPPGARHLPAFIADTSYLLLGSETLVSPLLWAVHHPSSALSAGEKWFRYTWGACIIQLRGRKVISTTLG